ncbi:MAG: transketolase [Micropepsaceae bacterium]
MNANAHLHRLTANFANNSSLVEHLTQRASVIRRLAISAIYHAGSGHPGGSLSCADLLSTLYGAELNIDPALPLATDRNRFVLSKGHGAPALYSAWAAYGHIPKSEALALRKIGRKAQGHPHVLDFPLAETSTGSLGQGFSTAIGMALGLRHQKISARVYTMLGDGELQEGEVWEGAMSAGHFGLSNLCAIIDYNKLQSDDRNQNIMALEPLAQKWRAFGWHAVEIQGHDISAILASFDEARSIAARPTVVIAHTVKGKGVAYMEDQPLWHGSVKLSREQTEAALASLATSSEDVKEMLDGSR